MIQLVKDSHHWPDFETFFNWLDCVDHGCVDDFTTDYIRIGFKNAIKNGYNMRKIKKARNNDISGVDKRRKKNKRVHP